MTEQSEKTSTEDFKWITERETASSILTKLAELAKASKYDLASQLDVSYATVMNYIRKFEDAGLVAEVGEVQAERGGKKTLYKITQKAQDVLLKIKSSKAPEEMKYRVLDVATSAGSLALELPHALYSMNKRELERKGEDEEFSKELDKRGKVQDILDEMKVDVAVVVNYRGHAIPIAPLSALGGIGQVNAVFSEKLNQRIQEVAVKIAEKLAEAE